QERGKAQPVNNLQNAMLQRPPQVGIQPFEDKNERAGNENALIRKNQELAGKLWKQHDHQQKQQSKGRQQLIEEPPLAGRAGEDELGYAGPGNRQAREDLQLDKKPEFAKTQLSPGEQRGHQGQVGGRSTHVGLGR